MTRKTARRAFDFYPTPAAAARPALQYLAPRVSPLDSFLDPAAGNGSLIRAGRDFWPEAHWSAIEIDTLHADALELVAENVQIADALAVEWPDNTTVIANPPFGSLDAFWQKISEHRTRFGVWCAVFHPVAWWSAEKRRGHTKPDAILSLGWRPSFHAQAGAAHKPMQDFAWSILAPTPQRVTEWHRVERKDAA